MKLHRTGSRGLMSERLGLGSIRPDFTRGLMGEAVMDRDLYLYASNKASRVVHQINQETGMTFCKIERSRAGSKIKGVSDVYPNGRKFCPNCETIRGRAQ